MMNGDQHKNRQELKKKLIPLGNGVYKLESRENSLSLYISGWPERCWREWNEDCRRNYDNIRWHKAWSDHLKLKTYSDEIKLRFDRLEAELIELKSQLIEINKKPEKEEKKQETVMTLAGELK